MSKQFGTFDTKEDRRELVILFQKLGEGLPEIKACEIRGKWLEMLICLSGGFDSCPAEVNPTECHPVGAYQLFVHIVGVLMVPIKDAVALLEDCVRKKAWLKPTWATSENEKMLDLATK